MADGKWIRGLRPDMDLREAARHVLKVRLQVVREYLPRAMHESHDDPEYVHQLRVGTRRADAALRIFRPCLPGANYRSARTRLRTVRRAAGSARDWDVFLLALRDRANTATPKELPGLDHLIGYAMGQRNAAQTQLAGLESHPKESFARFIDGTLEALRSPDEEDARLVDLARPMMTTLLEQLDQAASEDLRDYERLHQVRIAGKRLRYALEVLGECFPPSFASMLYPMIEEMQDVLGRANDSHVASSRLTSLRQQLKDWPDHWERVKAGLEGLLRCHQRRLPQERKRFVKLWERWRQACAEAVVSEG